MGNAPTVVVKATMPKQYDHTVAPLNLLLFEKMQLDVDIEPTLRFPGMTSIEKEMDLSESKLSIYLICISTTDRQKAMHKSPPCNLHRWAQKVNTFN